MSEQLQKILAELRERLTDLYGDRLDRLILYGSQARGDAEPDSDIDVLVVLKGEVQASKELDEISYITADLTVKYGQLVSTVVASAAEYESRTIPLHDIASREGIRL
jgi:uncharacterized protein